MIMYVLSERTTMFGMVNEYSFLRTFNIAWCSWSQWNYYERNKQPNTKSQHFVFL